MKALTIILSMIGLVSLNSCTQETNPQAVLENPETRTEVFNDIAQNDDYMTEFMENMHNNPQAMQMMQMFMPGSGVGSGFGSQLGSQFTAQPMQQQPGNMFGNAGCKFIIFGNLFIKENSTCFLSLF